VEQKKVVWLAHEANLSGANIAMLEYIDALKADYKFYAILPHKGNMASEFKKRGVNFSIIPQYNWAAPSVQPKKSNSFKFYVRSFWAIIQTCALIFKVKPKFVFTNTQVPFTACIAAFILKKPHVWWLHEFGEEDFGFTIGFGNKQLTQKWMQRSKLLIANSLEIKNKFATLLPKAKVECIYQPVTINSIKKVEKKLSPYFMFGQITPSKGHVEVLEALSHSGICKDNLVLTIVGPSEDVAYLSLLNKTIEDNKLSNNVKIEIGFFRKEEIMPSYNFLIIASKSEAFGRVAIEANKMGLKVIAKNNGGLKEIVGPTNGLLYNNKEELVEILQGKIEVPVTENKMPYQEAAETAKLKKHLDAIA
jgi:glycosyltransferase involved in cell wall biosynthesis